MSLVLGSLNYGLPLLFSVRIPNLERLPNFILVPNLSIHPQTMLTSIQNAVVETTTPYYFIVNLQ